MDQHYEDLIMALAEGSLDPEAAEAARAEIASYEESIQDLELQRAAIDALGSMPEARLTEMESARLRRDLRAELGIAKQTVFEPSRKRRRMPLAALGTAAAVLLAVVVVGPGLDLIGGSDSDGTADFIAEAADTTAAPATTMAATEALPNAGAAGEEDVARTTLAPALTTTTAAPVEPTAAAKLYAFFSDEPDLEELRQGAADFGFDPETVRTQTARSADDTVTDESEDQSLACIDVTLTIDSDLVSGFQIARGELDGRDVLYVIYLAEDLEESLLLVQAADNCEELRRVGP